MTDDRSIPLADPATHLTGHVPRPAPERPWRVIDRLVVVVFCLGLVVPGALLAVGKRSAEIENRPLLKAPALSIGGLFDPAWYAAIDRFLTDNDAVRPIAVRLRGEAWWKLGGTGNPDVVKGLGTWLFTIEEIAARCELSADDVTAALDRTRAAFAEAGQEFRFVLAPDKHAIYPDRVDPSSPYPPSCSDVRRPVLAAALDARSAFAVNGWAALAARRAADPSGPLLYYTQDSHWTPSGALAAIRRLIESFGPGLWSDADVSMTRSKRVEMELARLIGLRHAEIVPAPTVRPGVTLTRTIVEMPVKTTGARAVYRYTAAGDRPLVPGRTVIVYDSFFGLNIGSVAPFFENTIWIHEGDLLNHPEIAGLVGPVDRVILERVERGLYFTHVDDLLRPLVGRGGG